MSITNNSTLNTKEINAVLFCMFHRLELRGIHMYDYCENDSLVVVQSIKGGIACNVLISKKATPEYLLDYLLRRIPHGFKQAEG